MLSAEKSRLACEMRLLRARASVFSPIFVGKWEFLYLKEKKHLRNQIRHIIIVT